MDEQLRFKLFRDKLPLSLMFWIVVGVAMIAYELHGKNFKIVSRVEAQSGQASARQNSHPGKFTMTWTACSVDNVEPGGLLKMPKIIH
ncbi:hypothetical protein D3C80_1630910 [compost metagenome]